MLLPLGQSTRGNGERLGVRHFSDGDFTAIEHLDGFSANQLAAISRIAAKSPSSALSINLAAIRRRARG